MVCDKNADQCDVFFGEIINRETGTFHEHYGVAIENVIFVLNLTSPGPASYHSKEPGCRLLM